MFLVPGPSCRFSSRGHPNWPRPSVSSAIKSNRQRSIGKMIFVIEIEKLVTVVPFLVSWVWSVSRTECFGNVFAWCVTMATGWSPCLSIEDTKRFQSVDWLPVNVKNKLWLKWFLNNATWKPVTFSHFTQFLFLHENSLKVISSTFIHFHVLLKYHRAKIAFYV